MMRGVAKKNFRLGSPRPRTASRYWRISAKSAIRLRAPQPRPLRSGKKPTTANVKPFWILDLDFGLGVGHARAASPLVRCGNVARSIPRPDPSVTSREMAPAAASQPGDQFVSQPPKTLRGIIARPLMFGFQMGQLIIAAAQAAELCGAAPS